MATVGQALSIRKFLLSHGLTLAVLFLVVQTSLFRGFGGSGGFAGFGSNQSSVDDAPQFLNAVFTVAMLISITLA